MLTESLSVNSATVCASLDHTRYEASKKHRTAAIQNHQDGNDLRQIIPAIVSKMDAVPDTPFFQSK
jgi:hypothetical protein